jgi:hypothetical protein
VTSLIKLATADAPVTPAPAPFVATPATEPVSRPAKPAATTVAETTYPKAKPVVLPPLTRSATSKPVVAAAASKIHPATQPAGQAMTVVKPASAPQTKKPSGSTPVATTSTNSKKVAQSPTKPKHAKHVVVADTARDNLAPPPEEAYPRAKPVDTADLVAAPTVMNTLPPARAPIMTPAPIAPATSSTDAADPNSLGAQLNPFHNGGTPPTPMTPRFSGASLNDTPSSVTSPMGGVTGKPDNASP